MLYLSIAKLYKLDGRSALLSPKAMSLVQKETESHYLGKLTPEIRKNQNRIIVIMYFVCINNAHD